MYLLHVTFRNYQGDSHTAKVFIFSRFFLRLSINRDKILNKARVEHFLLQIGTKNQIVSLYTYTSQQFKCVKDDTCNKVFC